MSNDRFAVRIDITDNETGVSVIDVSSNCPTIAAVMSALQLALINLRLTYEDEGVQALADRT